LNKTQRLILKLCALVICAMTLYPPYQLVGRGMGYHWLFGESPHRHATINGVLLLVQWVGACLVSGIAYVLAKDVEDSKFSAFVSESAKKQGVWYAILALRAIRGLMLAYGVIAALGLLFDLLRLTVGDDSGTHDPGGFAAVLLVKILALGVLLGVATAMRLLINRVHSARKPSNGVLLPTWRSL